MALFDRRGGSLVWSVSGEERTSAWGAENDVLDPKQTSPVRAGQHEPNIGCTGRLYDSEHHGRLVVCWRC